MRFALGRPAATILIPVASTLGLALIIPFANDISFVVLVGARDSVFVTIFNPVGAARRSLLGHPVLYCVLQMFMSALGISSGSTNSCQMFGHAKHTSVWSISSHMQTRSRSSSGAGHELVSPVDVD